ncbi:MAG TPA: hypothetical protein PLW37_04550 [bacterium]|nr:hypothetical protein [Candidatus Cloacimonadota bacterium]HQB09117.1 hypothetical protein [bacterium]
MKRLLLVLIILIAVSSMLFADNTAQESVNTILTDTIAQVIALFLIAVLNLIVYAINRYFNLKINKDKVIAFIAEKSAEAKSLDLSEDLKKKYVVDEIKKDKNISKWTNIFYHTASAGAELIYRNIIKKVKQ